MTSVKKYFQTIFLQNTTYKTQSKYTFAMQKIMWKGKQNTTILTLFFVGFKNTLELTRHKHH